MRDRIKIIFFGTLFISCADSQSRNSHFLAERTFLAQHESEEISTPLDRAWDASADAITASGMLELSELVAEPAAGHIQS